MYPESRIKLLMVAAMVALVAGCGFHLRGSFGLPFKTLSLSLAPTTELYASMRRAIEASSSTKVIGDPKQAEANLIVLEDSPQRNILSLNSSGRAREYQLIRTFRFTVTNAKNVEYVPPSKIVVRREIAFNDDLILSKEAEEALLWRDMQSDMVQQLLRRLAAAKLTPEDGTD